MDAEVLKSYLVKLGFGVDHPELIKFQQTVESTGRQIENFAEGAASTFLKMGAAVATAYATVATATVSLLDKVSQADMGYQLFSMRMYMTNEMGKKLKITMDALGYSVEDLGILSMNPEMRGRIKDLFDLQTKLQSEMGPDFEERMRKLRDLRQEFTKVQVTLQYLGQSVALNVARALGLEDSEKVQRWVNWLVDNVPMLAQKISDFLVPILKDAWAIFKDLYDIGESIVSIFPALWKALGGDEDGRIHQGQSTLEQLAITIDEISRALRNVIDWVAKFKNAIGIGTATGAGATLGFEIGSFFGPIGTAIGTAIGGTAGFLFGKSHYSNRDNGASAPAQPNMDLVDHMRELAYSVSEKTGIPAERIFGIWAHETGFFSSRKFLQDNNLAGLQRQGQSRHFGSVEESADFFANLMNSRNYEGVRSAGSDYAAIMAMKSGGYYEDTFANYYRGVKSFEPYYGQGGDMHIGSVNVHINQPGASAEEVQRHVHEGIRDAHGDITQRQLAGTGSPIQ